MGKGHEAVTQAVPQWRHSPALEALDELVELAALSVPAMSRRAGLTETEMHALRHLMKEDIGPAELARLLGVTSAAATGIIDRLESRGHITRHAHPSDRRRTVVDITESGRAEVLALLTPMFVGLAEADAALTEHERTAVTGFLQRASAAIRQVM